MEFCYSDNDGLDKWGKLNPTFSPCSLGQRQSPINSQKNLTVHNKLLKPLTRNYKHVNATLKINEYWECKCISRNILDIYGLMAKTTPSSNSTGILSIVVTPQTRPRRYGRI
ncbi:hypothetical protein Goarm_010209 [Gossypium armourianum]|uniref:Alpha-carbonic anhydrase domain-containing protein n=1 Tax=Gossypium armourianum TaxID=34283 RepID=A0A7J9JVA7_9ROSI|nr:hypothetical protein [Gossypium armourianum]